jgi:CDP-paratose 2-epimerase
VEDLVQALRLAVEHIGTTSGQVYNIGGGPDNTLSVWLEFKQLLSELTGRQVEAAEYRDWRPGDQPVYISDISSAKRDFGWEPEVDASGGIERLYRWVENNKELFT